MPWSKVSEAPANIRKLNGVSLTLAHVNWIARVADGIPKEQVDSPWGVAIAQFKKAHKVEGDKWVKKSKKEEKELSIIIDRLGLGHYASLSDEAVAIIEKNDSGTYNIMTVSTAAVEDREGETFTVDAIDYDIAQAKEHGDYPEYRVFHSKHLGIGRVTSMRRVGIFAVDKGESYDDPFSLAVCEKMLANNNGKWRVSRGFRVHELSGACPQCSNSLLISTKHMLVGFRCQGCDTVHLRFKGVLDGIQFKKARTFDITVTDVPAVPYTGALAWRDSDNIGGMSMTKKELRSRLIEAGVPKDAVDERLKDLTEKQLKEFDDIPQATLLKELGVDESDDDGDDDAVVVEFDDMVNEFKQVVRAEIDDALEGFQVEISGLEDLTVEAKEVKGFQELKEQVDSIDEKLDILMEAEEDRLKQLLDETPRAGKIRLQRLKKGKKGDADDDDEEDDEDLEALAEKLKVSKETLSWIKGVGGAPDDNGDRIVASDGQEFESMTAMIQNNPVSE